MKEDKILVVPHRGGVSEAPENTLEAIKILIEKGAPFIEIDTRLSKDKVPFVIHDDSLSRVWEQESLISEMTASEIQEIRGKSGAFKGLKIPTLKEALELAHNKIGVMVEVKSDEGLDHGFIAKQVMEVVTPFLKDSSTPIYIGCFYPQVLAHVKRLMPEMKTVYIVLDKVHLIYSDLILPDFLAVNTCIFSEETMEFARSRGLPVWVWVVNEKSELEKCRELKVAGVFTDQPVALGLL